MAESIRFGERAAVVPVLAPVDTATTAVWSTKVDMENANWVTFLVNFGACSSAGATCDDTVIYVECSSINSTAGHDECNFTYRLSGAVATDTMGSITTGTSAGITVGPALDNKLVIIDVDPAEIESRTISLGVAQRWVGLHLVPQSTITLVGAVAIVEHSHLQNDIPSTS